MDEWIKIEEGCKLPNPGQTVLVSVWADWSYGNGTDIEIDTDCASFNDSGTAYINTDIPFVGFDTYNDWDEGEPLKVLAWMDLPEPYKEPNRAIKILEEQR